MSAVKLSRRRYGEIVNVNLISFGYKNGIPKEATIVLDARGIRNPGNIKHLRHLKGTDLAVQIQVLEHPIADRILAEARDNVDATQENGDQEFRLGIGCSFGRHRSVALVEILAEQLTAQGHKVVIEHRDKDKVFDGRRGGKGR